MQTCLHAAEDFCIAEALQYMWTKSKYTQKLKEKVIKKIKICLLKRVTQKGNFCVTLDSKILMYDSTLRFSHLRKP